MCSCSCAVVKQEGLKGVRRTSPKHIGDMHRFNIHTLDVHILCVWLFNEIRVRKHCYGDPSAVTSGFFVCYIEM